MHHHDSEAFPLLFSLSLLHGLSSNHKQTHSCRSEPGCKAVLCQVSGMWSHSSSSHGSAAPGCKVLMMMGKVLFFHCQIQLDFLQWMFFLSVPCSPKYITMNSHPHFTKITMDMNFSSLFVTNMQVGKKSPYENTATYFHQWLCTSGL